MITLPKNVRRHLESKGKERGLSLNEEVHCRVVFYDRRVWEIDQLKTDQWLNVVFGAAVGFVIGGLAMASLFHLNGMTLHP